MDEQTDSDEILRRIMQWGDRREDVRAAILTSTRAIPGASLDSFSDYDVILVVTDIIPYFKNRDWLGDFGPVLVVYRDPLQFERSYERFAYITQYQDGLKIDFSLWPTGLLQAVAQQLPLPDYLDIGYRVLLDKDDLTVDLKPPSYQGFIPTPPSQNEYREVIEEFWHESTYVAKNLWRQELLPAKYSLDHVMKFKLLRKMLEWLAQCKHGWQLKTGAYGKGLGRRIPLELWQELEATYVGAEMEENWQALFRTCNLFLKVATDVGESLGYPYPHELNWRVEEYLRKVHRTMDVD